MTTRINVSDVVFREDLYPRFEPNPATIQQYAESIEFLPPIEVNQHNELIDGYHRWTAHKKVKADTIEATVTQTKSDKEFLELAIQRNVAHGLQLSNAEKKSFVLRLYTGDKDEKERFADLFKVSLRTVSNWTARRDKDLKEERNKKIFDMWLACYTINEIEQEVDLAKSNISEVIKECSVLENFPKQNILASYQDEAWAPPLYNVWKLQTKTNGTNHFGNSEASFVDNLLYMYTQPFDIVVDPFGGGGSTIDVCKKRLRRYWVSDRLPIVERRDIRQADILDGTPDLHKRWSSVALLYLDPPYWKQAEGKYSQDTNDLANMSLRDFYKNLTDFTLACAKKMSSGSRVAMLMQPTQWKNEDKSVTDHVFDLLVGLTGNILKLDKRIICPYESQQCTAQQVEWAKQNKDVLIISRELIVWEVR